MDKEKLKLIIRNMESLVDCLKSEVYSENEIYTPPAYTPDSNYDEVFSDG